MMGKITHVELIQRGWEYTSWPLPVYQKTVKVVMNTYKLQLLFTRSGLQPYRLSITGKKISGVLSADVATFEQINNFLGTLVTEVGVQ